MNIIKESETEIKKSNRGDIYIFKCEYPEKNPPNALKDIVDCLEHIGIFDGINRS